MQRRYSFVHLILCGVVSLGLMLLTPDVEVRAQITFASSKGGSMEIYVMDADGNNQRRLTNNRDRDLNPSWSPDGKRIAFVSNRDGHFPGNISTNEIYVMDADGGNPQNLTNNPRSDNFPSWSPDGKRIVFSARRNGHFRGDFAITSEIYVMDADGKNQRRLTNNRQNDWHPSWSPDGKRIVFSSDRKGNWKNFEIYVMDADGKNPQRLTNNPQNDQYPSWSPNSKKISFHSRRDGNMEIYVMDADGGNLQNLTNNPLHTDIGPAWLNSPFSVAHAGKKFTMWGRLKQIAR